MQIEHVAGVSFTTGRTAQQQGDLTIRPGLLGQVIVNDQRVFAAIAEVFAHGATGVRCQELHRGGVGGGSGNDDGVAHRAVFFQFAYYVGNGRSLLADRNVDTGHVLTFLIDDGVNRNSCLAGLTVANDQFALTAADRHHGVDGLQTGLHRLVNGLTCDHARSDLFDLVGHLRIDRTLAVDRLAQCVHHAAAQLGADGHFQNAAGALDRVAFGDVFVFAQNNGADGVALKVQRQAESIAGEFQHFALHHIGQAVHANDTVGHADHRSFGARLGQCFEVIDATADQIANFGRVELHLDFLILDNSLSG